ncbi:MAG: oligopeptide transporter, OPT family [Firmicutes bacterium]|nr:oligopeptide transporter, OPT family [Bacillota bacterium]
MPNADEKMMNEAEQFETSGEEFKPYVPADKEMPEITFLSVALGIIQAIIFGMAMVYVGLKIGMTISASIPAAVISMGVLKGLFKRGTILENNIVQTICSAGVSIASGVIFTIPAAFLWSDFQHHEFSLGKIAITAVIGGILGVLMMIPLRRYLIVQEHGKLKFPEGTACAEVLVAGDIGGNPAKLVFSGIAIGAIYKFMQNTLKLWKDEIGVQVPIMKNLMFTAELSPILLGVGYIIGLEVSAIMLSGGLLAWFVIIPLITHFLSTYAPDAIVMVKTTQVVAKDLTADQIWEAYIRYIGAGAVAFGGMISLAKALPTIVQSFKVSVVELFHTLTGGEKAKSTSVKRTEDDLPITWVIGGSLILIILIAFSRNISNDIIRGAIGSLLVFVFGFFFVTVSSRIVGLVGSSSNPVSGMTIGTLILSCIIFRALNFTGIDGMVTALLVGAFVCIAMCTAGDISQDLKTGYLVGATPRKQQMMMIVGVLSSSIFIAWILLYLKDNIGFTGTEGLKAPQANLMSLVIQGIMSGNLPWTLVLAGGFISICIELLGIPALPFAVGLYLPLSLSTPLIVGGLISWAMSKIYKNADVLKEKLEKGVLVASGLIAGDALMGIIVVALKVYADSHGRDFAIKWPLADNIIVGVVIFLAVGVFLWHSIKKEDKA